MAIRVTAKLDGRWRLRAVDGSGDMHRFLDSCGLMSAASTVKESVKAACMMLTPLIVTVGHGSRTRGARLAATSKLICRVQRSS
jgi:hypothetical protein